MGNFRTRLSAFGHHLAAGIVVMLAVFLPWKILQITNLTLVFDYIAKGMTAIGAPVILGHLVTVTLSLMLISGLGWLVGTFIKYRRDQFPLIAGLLETPEHLDRILNSKRRGDIPVVLVSWPTEQVRTLGIVTREITDATSGRTLFVVYIPNTPNPASGIMRVVEADHITNTDLDVAQVMTMSFSRGATTPTRIELIGENAAGPAENRSM